jgi:hypothetical protein
MKTISQTNNKKKFLDILINPYNYKEKIIPIEYFISKKIHNSNKRIFLKINNNINYFDLPNIILIKK